MIALLPLGVLQVRWALFVNKKDTIEMCFPDKWTWHMILKTIKSRREKEIEEVEKKLQYKNKSFSKRIK